MSGKWLELLREIAPRVARAGVLRDSGNVAEIGVFGAIQSAAPSLGTAAHPAAIPSRALNMLARVGSICAAMSR